MDKEVGILVGILLGLLILVLSFGCASVRWVHNNCEQYVSILEDKH